jgi:hypothetical protein
VAIRKFGTPTTTLPVPDPSSSTEVEPQGISVEAIRESPSAPVSADEIVSEGCAERGND